MAILRELNESLVLLTFWKAKPPVVLANMLYTNRFRKLLRHSGF